MKEKIKGVIIVVIAMLIASGTTVTALLVTNASNITLSSEKTVKTNVKDALDELYSLSSSGIGMSSCSNNVSPPKITGDLIPVTISKDGTVKKADTSSSWYDYCDKQWANAVILLDKTKTYNVGETIPESNIESYFVWIPKYKYRLWNIDTVTPNPGPHIIDIIFDTANTTDVEGESCATPLFSGESGNCNNGEFMTHPAFITMEVNGFWVGKFETGYKGATTTAAAQVTSDDASKIIVKPNVYSWRNNTVYNMFVSSYNYNRTLNSHMMKNTEWGAVAYLSHSIYGINAEININNDSNYLTGKSGLLTLDQHTYTGTSGTGDSYNKSYNTDIGYLASTTGNISGIYDMSGGTHSYVASYRANTLGPSGFNATTIASYDSKFFDIYDASSTETSYQYRILGDATGELGPFKDYKDGDNLTRHHGWYGDESSIIDSSYPWFVRGGCHFFGTLAGAFYFSRTTGGTGSNIGSRLVLAP